MSDLRNPYLQDTGETLLRPSVVAFLDILGYRDMVLEAEKSGTGQQFLSLLHRTLKAAVNKLRDPLAEEDELFKSSLLTKDLHKVVSFTDNIVIGYPISGDAESELGFICHDLANFQLTMVKAGFFIRRAISLGHVYIDDFVVYGRGLIDAYDAEVDKARDPRIILTDSAQAAVKRHLRYYTNPAHAPQIRDLYRDADGQFLLNYIDETMIAEDELGPDFESISQHKVAVENKLKDYTDQPPLWSKYAWVANYHNFFCDLHSITDEYKIDLSNFQMKPSLIIEPP